jgi:hypothetical protein
VNDRLPLINAYIASWTLPKSLIRASGGLLDKGKPPATAGRKASGPQPRRRGRVAGLPKGSEGVMQYHALLAWKAWSKAFAMPLWNPYGAAITATLFALLLAYMLKSVMSRQ